MSKRLMGAIAAVALGAGILVGPLATGAGAAQSSHAASAVGLTDHCAVIPLAGGLEITLCFPT